MRYLIIFLLMFSTSVLSEEVNLHCTFKEGSKVKHDEGYTFYKRGDYADKGIQKEMTDVAIKIDFDEKKIISAPYYEDGFLFPVSNVYFSEDNLVQWSKTKKNSNIPEYANTLNRGTGELKIMLADKFYSETYYYNCSKTKF